MSARTAAWLLLAFAAGCALAGAFPVALFLAITAVLVELTAPTSEQLDAQRRNHARRIR